MVTNPNIWAILKDRINSNVLELVGTGRPTNGTSGSGAALGIGPGSTYVNLSTGGQHVNTGLTLGSPVWEDTAGVRLARATYDFAVDGGAAGLITPAVGANYILPSGSIILGGIIDIKTTFTSGGSATISVGLSAGGAGAAALKAATAVASWTAGLMAIVPLFAAANMIKMTAEGTITFTVAVADLTAGKAEVKLLYIPGL